MPPEVASLFLLVPLLYEDDLDVFTFILKEWENLKIFTKTILMLFDCWLVFFFPKRMGHVEAWFEDDFEKCWDCQK